VTYSVAVIPVPVNILHEHVLYKQIIMATQEVCFRVWISCCIFKLWAAQIWVM